MSVPDPVAALAAQLDELRGQVARYTGETGALRARLETDSGQAVMIRLEVKQLREQLAEAVAKHKALDQSRGQGDAGHLKARLEDISGQVATLRLEVGQLREHLAKAASKRQLKPPPAPCWCVDQAEGQAMLADLRQWVETFLRRHYPGYMARLPRCWERHPEAIWELSTLRAEWERIYGDEDNRDLRGALNWHDKWFPGGLSRLAAAIKCDELGCQVTAR